MPRVILLYPFIKHYAGTVFDLNETIISSDWNDDERIREKQSQHSKWVYFLPDAGNGRSAELYESETIICPDDIFKNINIKIGPCRITSIKELPMDTVTIKVNLLLSLKAQLAGNVFPLNNKILIACSNEMLVDSIELYNILTNQKIQEFNTPTEIESLTFESLDPGFYNLQLLNKNTPIIELRIFKNFPLVVTPIKYTNRFTSRSTIW
ncbi:MAG: hypothetical protein IPO78_12820 [Saprospiraceae bacterium]|nr:hypothetical protein [Saprospiraceae bacterium]MBK9722480.1 hypothetical protein [Saprospiraceae bacterium]